MAERQNINLLELLPPNVLDFEMFGCNFNFILKHTFLYFNSVSAQEQKSEKR